MKKASFCFVLLLSVTCGLFAQRATVITGQVVNADGQPIKNVAVLAKMERITGSPTNEKGLYFFKVNAEDSILVSYSHPQYETLYMKFAPTDTIRNNVVLADKTNKLAEVVVQGQAVRVSNNSIVYLPTQKQKNSSNSGLSLLYNIMLPELNVNPFTNSVSATDGTNVSFYVEGRKTDMSEVKDIRPKDVVRVELYNNAVEMFPNEQKVVNFVLRHYDYGGYVDIKTDNRAFYNYHEQRVQAHFDKRRWNYTLAGGMTNVSDDGIMSGTEDAYMLSTPFSRNTETVNGKNNNDSYFGAFRSSYTGKSLFFHSQVMVNTGNNTLKNDGKVIYSPETYTSGKTSLWHNDKTVSPSLNLYLKKNWGMKSSLEASVSSSYQSQKYKRQYTELDAATNNDVKENAYSVTSTIKWNRIFNRHNSVSLLLWDVFRHNRDKYTGSEENDQKLQANDLLFYPTYSYNNGKLYLSCQLGFNLSSTNVNGLSYTKMYPRPALVANYYLSKKNSMYLDVKMGSTVPQLSMMNTVEQKLDQFQIVRGNPDLDVMKILDALLAYNIHTNNIQMSAFVQYNALYDLSKLYYIADNDKFVHTYISDGNYVSCSFGVNSVFHCFDRNLQISCNLAYKAQRITGEDKSDMQDLFCRFNLLWRIKDYTLSAYYSSKTKSLQHTPMVSESPCDYGLLASWGGRGLLIEIGARRMFEKRCSIRRYYSYDVYDTNARSWSDAQARQVYLKVSYNFDFGRKTKRSNIENNSSVQSSIVF